jgi:hypothetical protein
MGYAARIAGTFVDVIADSIRGRKAGGLTYLRGGAPMHAGRSSPEKHENDGH